MNRILFLVIALCFGCAAYSEGAGRIRGCISDENGGALPGVEIVVSGQRLSKDITSYSDQSGCYLVDKLLGARYQIAFRLPGFTPQTMEDVVVFSGKQTTLNATLKILVSAEMIVRARKPLRDIAASSENLIGIATAASEGAVRSEQLALRPLLRSGEVLESVPGVIISQHSGQGKANQYYLRGFNLDHGTDLAISLDGIPVNFPTHAHGQGYADLSFLIPELIHDVQYKKGPYYADEGDFSSAGAVHIDYARNISSTNVGVEGGTNEYGRALFLSSPRLGSGQLLVATELFHNNGPWENPDGYKRVNGVLRYSIDSDTDSYSLLGMFYDGRWNATDQVPHRAVASGQIGRFGTIDHTDGGRSSRYSLSADWKHSWTDALTNVSAFILRYRLNLFSNFTYFLDDPVNGDQFEQADSRIVSGAAINHRWITDWFGLEMENETGLGLRNDTIGTVGLYRTKGRQRIGTTRQDDVNERSLSLYWQTTTTWHEKVRTSIGLRADYFQFDVQSSIPLNSGNEKDAILSPKLSFIAGPWRKSEFYANFGYGFHSNDARGTTIRVDPISGEPADAVDPLVRSRGTEFGVRTSAFRSWQTTAALWLLDFDSEQLFVGDAGITEPSRPSQRKGFEWNNYFKPLPWMTLEINWAHSVSRFTDNDPAGNRIPGAIEGVFTTGLWLQGLTLQRSAMKHTIGVIQSPNISGLASDDFWSRIIIGLQLRYFGPRPLIEDNSVRAPSSTLVNLALGYTLNDNWNTFVDLFNILNSKSSDIDYYYASRLPGEATGGVEDFHTHPVEPFAIRFSLTRRF